MIYAKLIRWIFYIHVIFSLSIVIIILRNSKIEMKGKFGDSWKNLNNFDWKHLLNCYSCLGYINLATSQQLVFRCYNEAEYFQNNYVLRKIQNDDSSIWRLKGRIKKTITDKFSVIRELYNWWVEILPMLCKLEMYVTME